MKTIIKSKIMMALVVLAFAFASAQNSVTLKLTGQTKAEGIGKGEDAKFVNSGSNIDDFSIGFKAVLDNVTASVTIEDDGDDDGSDLGFDSAYIEVADLFDGLLTLKFFDIGYAAGYDNSIRPDLGSHGIKFTLKPIDMLSISLGYGINTGTIHTAGVGLVGTNAIDSSASSRNLHLIQLDVGINNAFVPATIYFGTVIADSSTELKLPKKVGGELEEVTIAHMSAGFTADLLAALLAGAVNLDLGVVFPLHGTSTFFDPDKNQSGEGEYENELNLVAALHGDIANLGVEGLGLAYDLVFALDTHTKQTTLDDMDGTANSDTFYDLFKVDVTPSYTLGQFKIALNFIFGMVGENTARVIAAADDAKAFNRYEITPSVTWSPAEIASIKGYFTYEDPNSETDDDEFMTLGLDYTATIGVSGL